MRIDEYLSRYEKYRDGYNSLKKVQMMFNRSDNKNKAVFLTNRHDFMRFETLEHEIARRERILRYANARMEAAISRMDVRSQANYIMCRYFYGMKNTEIANTFSYCERHVYRLASKAKKNFYHELVKLMPNPRRGETGKAYRYSMAIKKQAV